MASISSGRSFNSIEENYKAALTKLNEMVSNRAILTTGQYAAIHLTHIPNMKRYCDIAGITDDSLNSLNVIHITGTKGKGSTCAYVESILRHRGYRTGFYSSPHLIDTRERIRINGLPISQEQFCNHFWPLVDVLTDKLASDVKPPFYFAFLTLMAMQVFISEKVDVAVIEVGIGGRYDNTTVVPNPVVCGIASLGFDHMHVLGNTIEEIAFNKAGIIRGNCITITAANQPEEGVGMLKEEAIKQECPIFTAPEHVSSTPVDFLTEIQQLNASLALHLSYFWEQRRSMSLQERQGANKELMKKYVALHRLEPLSLDDLTLQALKSTKWPGRQHFISWENNIHFYLDGAHTNESLRKCREWFQAVVKEHGKKVLIFNMIGRRDYQLMRILMDITFDLVIFTPNVAFQSQENLASIEDSVDKLKEASDKLSTAWKEFRSEDNVACEPIQLVNSLKEAVDLVKSLLHPDEGDVGDIQVLITGSLHLIGAALHVLDPHCI